VAAVPAAFVVHRSLVRGDGALGGVSVAAVVAAAVPFVLGAPVVAPAARTGSGAGAAAAA